MEIYTTVHSVKMGSSKAHADFRVRTSAKGCQTSASYSAYLSVQRPRPTRLKKVFLSSVEFTIVRRLGEWLT